MLHQLVGSERFFGTLRAVLQDFGEQRLTLPELRARFELAAPEVDLARFFAQWLDRTGAPILECNWSADGDRALVRIRQVQPDEPYVLRLEIALDYAAGRHVQEIEIKERETHVTLTGLASPTDVVLDPRHRLLIWSAEYGPKPTK